MSEASSRDSGAAPATHTNPLGNTAGPGELAHWACSAEVCAPKAGNVHGGAAFSDTTSRDFIASAAAIRPALDRAADTGVGAAVLAAVRATREAVGRNTNLGMILLLAPLCAVPRHAALSRGVAKLLASCSAQDTRAVYEAIRLAQPGGLGAVSDGDVHGEAPPIGLVEAMRPAAARDAVARQYGHAFTDVIDAIAPRLAHRYRECRALDEAIVWAHLKQMADEPDSLIRRKCGDAVAAEAAAGARRVLDAGWPGSDESRRLFAQLDRWLRAEGNRRNPGTSADLVTAGLFVALRDGAIEWPALWSKHIAVPT